MSVQTWETELDTILSSYFNQVELKSGNLIVVGCSTSEVIGQRIGTAGSTEVAEMIFRILTKYQAQIGYQLAFQCCEHLNRALVVERTTATERGFDEVSVIPVHSAGGAMATYAFEHMKDPVMVETIQAEAGIDIGETMIGMHLKRVAVPIRTEQRTVGSARVVLAKTRPKLIGGPRAVYERTIDNTTCH
ncbi:TIGR01440 family protein [Bacillus marasmi]|uniref:TIGR01440 family protein n=1 Tax=Bacillus marasmi TaxID=1926279 RepID=UPI0011C9C353|nr:TIGR01440 family protein [Bacillus marasmi]